MTPFGRLQLATQVGCIIGNLVPSNLVDTDGLPKVGTFSITFPTDKNSTIYKSSSQGGCNMTYNTDPANGPVAGGTLAITVAAVTSTNFTKSMSTTVGNSMKMYLKLDSSNGVFNFMQAEDQRNGGRYAADRLAVLMSGLNGTNTTQIRMEYISLNSNNSSGSSNGVTSCTGVGSNCSFEIHRIFIDETKDQGYVLSTNGTYVNSTFLPQFALEAAAAGRPVELNACTDAVCAENIALSVNPIGQSTAASGSFTSTGDYNGCVSAKDGTLKTDGTLACNVTGTTISSATAINGILSVYGADPIATLLGNTSENNSISFTGASDIYTGTPTK